MRSCELTPCDAFQSKVREHPIKGDANLYIKVRVTFNWGAALARVAFQSGTAVAAPSSGAAM